MNVVTSESAKYFQIHVHGNLQSEHDRDHFLEAMLLNKFRQVEITFHDARILPAEVIIQLKLFIDSHPEVNVGVFVNNKSLGTYFFRLGIMCSLNQQYESDLYGRRRIRAVAMGGSAGSLEKIISVVTRLQNPNLSIFIVVHSSEDDPDHLSEILRSQTQLRIAEVKDGLPVEPGFIYIAPAGRHMVAERGYIRLSKERKVNFARPSIQVTFDSLGREFGSGLIAVLLCGYGKDGSQSFRALHQAGAVTIIEDPRECIAFELPASAWKGGYVHYKFPLPELISYLSRITQVKEHKPGKIALKRFFERIFENYGHDCINFNHERAVHRITEMMAANQIEDFSRFEEQILHNRNLFESLFLGCQDQANGIFQQPLMFAFLRRKILPLMSAKKEFKIWCTGCFPVQEAISVAVILNEAGILHQAQIYASHADSQVIEEAQNGLYPESYIANSQKNYAASGGMASIWDYVETSHGLSRLTQSIRNSLLLFHHSLMNRGVIRDFDLILCQHEPDFFDDELRTSVIDLFCKSLRKNGVLVLGKNRDNVKMPAGCKVYDPDFGIYLKE